MNKIPDEIYEKQIVVVVRKLRSQPIIVSVI